MKPAHISQSVWDDMSVHCEERDGKVVRDKQTVRVSQLFMDAAPRAFTFTDTAPAISHRPQSFPMNANDASDLAKLRADAEAKLNDAWRNPGPVAVADVGATERPSAPAFDASMSLDALRAEATKRLVESWRHP